ncbi:hypothetical protein FBY35_6267 [Streptomyces sp. SLBN-118]|nr:hypothetical protein FBY35_6267 [Streptomyces sp. SLBN-118]
MLPCVCSARGLSARRVLGSARSPSPPRPGSWPDALAEAGVQWGVSYPRPSARPRARRSGARPHLDVQQVHALSAACPPARDGSGRQPPAARVTGPAGVLLPVEGARRRDRLVPADLHGAARPRGDAHCGSGPRWGHSVREWACQCAPLSCGRSVQRSSVPGFRIQQRNGSGTRPGVVYGFMTRVVRGAAAHGTVRTPTAGTAGRRAGQRPGRPRLSCWVPCASCTSRTGPLRRPPRGGLLGPWPGP